MGILHERQAISATSNIPSSHAETDIFLLLLLLPRTFLYIFCGPHSNNEITVL
jgi:hypothetical protein